jgi:hypothetical protein
MTENELVFSRFEDLYHYDWYANPDGDKRTVIFSFIEKTMDRNDRVIKFEAQALEQAFNYAFRVAGLKKFDPDNWKIDFGYIEKFNLDKWSEVTFRDKFWSLGDKCWKSLAEVLEKEAEVNAIIANKRTIKLNEATK